MPPATPSPPLFTRFLDLPPELRNKIYEYAFTECSTYPTKVMGGCSHSPATRFINELNRTAICQASLFVNRQISSEARGIYNAAYRNHIENTVFTLIAKHNSKRSIRRALEPYYLSEETLLHANKINLEFWCKYCGETRIELTKQTPTEENDWNEWAVEQTIATMAFDPRFVFKITHPRTWKKHEDLKEATWRKMGKRGEGLLMMEIAALLTNGAGYNMRPGGFGIRASIRHGYERFKALF